MGYQIFWLAYLLAGVIALACWFYLTRGLRNAYLRWCLRLPLVALCFTPVQLSNDVSGQLWFAPSIAAIAVELLSKNFAALMIYLPGLLVSVGVSLILALVIARLSSKRAAE